METITITKNKYEEIVKEQRELSQKLRQLSKKIEILSKLGEFEKITSWGRKFAKEKKNKSQRCIN